MPNYFVISTPNVKLQTRGLKLKFDLKLEASLVDSLTKLGVEVEIEQLSPGALVVRTGVETRQKPIRLID